jgi:tight adherence protein C
MLALFGNRVPDFWLSTKITARRNAIVKALPDTLDLVVVCVEAGNSLEAGIARVAERLKGPLADELGRMLGEMSLGKLRREALRDLAKRAAVPDLQTFVAAILQADQMGVSIASALRVQADAMRVRRRQRAEEAAAKLPIKMLFPLLLMIFPALLVVILGPAAIYLMGLFGSVSLP